LEQGETIMDGDSTLAHIVRARPIPDSTRFVTTPEEALQVGHIVYPKGGAIPRHVHRAVERHLVGTAEVLLVQQGRCEIDLFGTNRGLVAQRVLERGDLIVILGGGHGLRMLEDTVLLEIKQGPYPGVAAEKEHF